jgi:D-amino peptidase
MRRLFIAADIEGIAGVANLDQLGPKEFEWPSARAWMTSEVAAAAEAGLSAGYDEVLIADGHGNAQNILPDRLPARTRLIRSWPRPLLQMQGIEQEGVDACLQIGFHAAARSAGNGVLAHTYHGGLFAELRLNGHPFPEAWFNAALAGEYGVPTILITGDDAACDELSASIPGIETCAVKSSIGWKSAASVTPQEGARMVGEAAARAIARRHEIAPFRVEGPYELEIEFSNRVSSGLLGLLPCFETVDPFVARFRCARIEEAMKAVSFAIFYPRGILG